MTSDTCKSGFASKDGRNGKNPSIEKDLAKFQLNPIPIEQNLKSTKGSYKGKNGRREKARRLRCNLGPLPAASRESRINKEKKEAYESYKYCPRGKDNQGKCG